MKNNQFIEVYDNLIPTDLSNYLENFILTDSQIPFQYIEDLTYPLSSPHRRYKPGICYNVINTNLYLQSTIIPTISFNILYRLGIHKNIIITTVPLARIFVDLPTPNPQPDFPPHTDSKVPHWVCLYYVNDSDGDTVFFDDDNNEIKRVSPKKGRIAFFDGSILHCGTPSDTRSRAVINFNFTGEKLGEEK